MSRFFAFAAALVIALSTAGNALAGIDEVFAKPKGKRSWGEIFKWATGASGFDKSYALVIGISEYTGDFQPLRSTKNDPIRMKDFLLEEAGFDYVHVLTDEKAHITRIRQLMKGKFPDLVKHNDRFLFYWSGHGTQNTDAVGRSVGYLPLAASKRNEWWTMIGMDEVAEWDRWIKAKHTLFLLDACFSGLAGSEAKATLQDFTIEQLSEPAHHLISAGTGSQQTIAADRWEGSIFTDSVIQAARGEADAQTAFPRDGIVSLAELLAFVRQRVDQERRSANWDKAITPQWNHLRSNKGEFFFVTKAKKIELAKREGDTTGEFDDGMPIGVMGKDATPPSDCDLSAEKLFWGSIKNETQAAYFEAYLARVEKGEFCGLFEDIARLKTQTLPQHPPNEKIKVQLSPERIRQVQEMLVAMGFNAGKADGVLGAKTRAAIIEFQRSNGSEVTGVLTEADEISLAKAYVDGLSSGELTGRSAEGKEAGTQVAVGPIQDGLVFRDCRKCPELVTIEPETIDTQSGIRPFALTWHEVTVEAFEDFASDASLASMPCSRLEQGLYYQSSHVNWQEPGFLQTGNNPVVCVTWDQAMAYADWISSRTGERYHLPSLMEWSLVTSYGRLSDDSLKGKTDCVLIQDNGDQPGESEVCEAIGQSTVGAAKGDLDRLGLAGLEDNVREWLADCRRKSSEQVKSDPRTQGACAVGGGSWLKGKARAPAWIQPGAASNDLGFRLVRELN